MYNLAISKLALEPKVCLVIEDSVNGVKAAKAAGCHVFAVPNKYSKNANYSDADKVFEDLEEIAMLFKKVKI